MKKTGIALLAAAQILGTTATARPANAQNTATPAPAAAAPVPTTATKIYGVDKAHGQIFECVIVPAATVAADTTGATPPKMQLFQQFAVPGTPIQPSIFVATDKFFKQAVGANMISAEVTAGVIKGDKPFVTVAPASGTAVEAQRQIRTAYSNLSTTCDAAAAAFPVAPPPPPADPLADKTPTQRLGGLFSGLRAAVNSATGHTPEVKAKMGTFDLTKSEIHIPTVTQGVTTLINPLAIPTEELAPERSAPTVTPKPGKHHRAG